VLNDQYLIEQMANFHRERIAERQPHAKGGGALVLIAVLIAAGGSPASRHRTPASVAGRQAVQVGGIRRRRAG
jgi:hypothetical protein